MPTARYTLAIDWDDDGDFDQLDEDLSRDVITAKWQLGLDDPRESVAAPSWAEITLRDGAGRYLPENSAGPLYGSLEPRKKARIASTYSGVITVHFTGWTESFQPRPDGTALVRLSGVESLLRRAEVFLPLGLDQTADTIIDAALDQVAYPPAINGYWLLGTAHLGEATRLPDVTTYADLETGISRFAYVGDTGEDYRPGRNGLSAWAAIRAAAEAERGWCFSDREGRVIFWNRHHLLKTVTSQAAFTDRDAAFEVLTDGADLINRAVVTCHPRRVGAAAETLWTLEKPLEIPAGGSTTIRARFTDESGERVGALSVITPVAGVDTIANSAADGSGVNMAASVSVTLESAANSALLTFHNSAAYPAQIVAGAVVRGVKITAWNAADAEAEDATSITFYGRRTFGLNLPLLSDLEEAARLARYVVLLGKDPRGRVETITLRNETSAATLAEMLSLTMGDRITLDDAHTGHRRDYHIVGERHTLLRGGTIHEAVWTLLPACPIAFWRLGVAGAGEMGTNTRVTY